MGQGGEHFIVTKDPKDVDGWGKLVKVAKVDEPPYGDSEELTLLNSINHIKVDDPNIALYMKESEENSTPNTIETKKVLYVYLEGLLTMKLTPIFLDKFGITYEPIE